MRFPVSEPVMAPMGIMGPRTSLSSAPVRSPVESIADEPSLEPGLLPPTAPFSVVPASPRRTPAKSPTSAPLRPPTDTIVDEPTEVPLFFPSFLSMATQSPMTSPYDHTPAFFPVRTSAAEKRPTEVPSTIPAVTTCECEVAISYCGQKLVLKCDALDLQNVFAGGTCKP
jgi:hypothetical protein